MSPNVLVKRLVMNRWAGVALVVLALLLSFFAAGDYGISTDEPENFAVGQDALRSLVSWQGFRDYLAHGEELAHHGPAYFMVYAAGAEVFDRLIPWWQIADARHWMNALAFLAGCVGVYALCLRFMNKPYAMLTTVFFASQPLLVGHAFINQKDTPFLAFFSISVISGLTAIDRLKERADVSKGAEGAGPEGMLVRVRADWGNTSVRGRVLVTAVAVVMLLVVLDVVWWGRGIALAQKVLAQAYKGQAWRPIQMIFSTVAQDAYKTPLALYSSKLDWAYLVGRPMLLLLVAAGGSWLAGSAFPKAIGADQKLYAPALRVSLFAGACLGFAISIRPIAGLAGALVGIYGLNQLKWRTIPLLLPYALCAAFVMYMTWPFLWPEPIPRLIASLSVTGTFDKPIRYAGTIIRGGNLPWDYFPRLASITLTEPFPLLVIIGAPVAVWQWRRRLIHGTDLFLLAMWAGIPLFGLIVLKMGVYDNLRQLHFVFVPFFVVAGLGMGFLLDAMRSWSLRLVLSALILLPSIVGILYLHPYEYAYFNSYVGGVDGAAGRYLMDSWCISYREAMAYVDEVAKPGQVIVALSYPDIARPYVRPDLKVSREYERPPADAAYLLTCSLFVGGYLNSPDWNRVYTVGRGRAIFAEVYQRVQAP